MLDKKHSSMYNLLQKDVMMMNHALLKQIIYDQHAVIRESKISPRCYSFDPAANYVLTGLRRAGKSTLMYRRVLELIASGSAWEQIICINFEDERLAEFSTSDFNDILAVQSEMSAEKGYFFLDEIQNIPDWEKFARRMADSGERVWITGSNAKMLSREIQSILGGRYLEKYILPYSFEEYLDAWHIPHGESDWAATRTRGRIAAAMQDYLSDGGFPETLRYQNRREYLSSVFQKILLGDIVARNGIRNEYAMRLLVKKIAETVMNEASYSKLHGTLKGVGISVSKDTVIDYVHYAEEAYLLFRIRNYFSGFSERESTCKYYFSDNGLLHLFLTNKRNALLENLTALTLRRRYGEDVFYLRSARTGVDVDFFIPDAGLAIQVCDQLNDDSEQRETGNLLRLSGTMEGVKRLLIITPETTRTLDREGRVIEVLPIDQFVAVHDCF